MNYQQIIEAALAIQPIGERKAERAPDIAWNAPVRAAELLTPGKLQKSGVWGIIAKHDQGETVVGSYKRGDVLTSNADLCQRVELALELLKWDFTVEHTVCRDGGGFTATYSILSKIPGMENLVHSPVIPQIKVRNSYDGVWKKWIEFAMKVCVCLNGAEGFLPGATMAIKHSKDSLGRFADGVSGVLESGKNALPSLATLGDMPLNDELAANLFANIASANSSKGAISNKTALTMLGHYMQPDDNEAKLAPSVWRAYMAGTRAMRDLSEVRPTQAQAANAALGRAMSFALSQPKAGSVFLHGHSSPYAALVAAPRVPLLKEKDVAELIEVEIA